MFDEELINSLFIKSFQQKNGIIQIPSLFSKHGLQLHNMYSLTKIEQKQILRKQ